ncbi:MAG: hypothetical protein ACREVE_12500 [Gammaproteobacteria bacterium]
MEIHELKKAGLKVTPQRTKILEILEATRAEDQQHLRWEGVRTEPS